MRLIGSLMAPVLLVVAGCGGGGSSGPRTPGGNTPPPSGGITVSNNAFSPTTKIVEAGTTVRWGWSTCTSGGGYGEGETCVAHSVTWADGSGSPLQETGSYSRNFLAAGTYNYHCSVHRLEGMTGTITVQ